MPKKGPESQPWGSLAGKIEAVRAKIPELPDAPQAPAPPVAESIVPPPKEEPDVDFKTNVFLSFPRHSSGAASSQRRISPPELFNKEFEPESKNWYVCDLHYKLEEIEESGMSLEDYIRDKILRFVAKKQRAKNEKLKYGLVIAGRGDGTMKGFVESVLNELLSEGKILQFIYKINKAGFNIEVA